MFIVFEFLIVFLFLFVFVERRHVWLVILRPCSAVRQIWLKVMIEVERGKANREGTAEDKFLNALPNGLKRPKNDVRIKFYQDISKPRLETES